MILGNTKSQFLTARRFFRTLRHPTTRSICISCRKETSDYCLEPRRATVNLLSPSAFKLSPFIGRADLPPIHLLPAAVCQTCLLS